MACCAWSPVDPLALLMMRRALRGPSSFPAQRAPGPVQPPAIHRRRRPVHRRIGGSVAPLLLRPVAGSMLRRADTLEMEMKLLLVFLAWCILFVLCWPLAVLALMAWPLLWLLSLPLHQRGQQLPARLLGWRPAAAVAR
jgi:hypothetical protein